jgi:hypothetical protein
VFDQACKPSSVPCAGAACARRQSSLYGGGCPPSPATYLRDAGRAAPAAACATALSVWSCSRWGLPSRNSHLLRWWSLAPPFHSHPSAIASGRPAFCCTIPSGHPAWELPSIALYGARTFLEPNAMARDCPAWSHTSLIISLEMDLSSSSCRQSCCVSSLSVLL